MKKNKQDIIIVRVTEVEKAMVKELKEVDSINISALIRSLIRDYYEKKKEIKYD